MKTNTLTLCYLILPILTATASLMAKPASPQVFDQKAKTDNIQFLMAAGSDHSEGKSALSRAYPKHFWLSGLKNHATLTWSIQLERAAEYHVDALLDAKQGARFSLAVSGGGAPLRFTKIHPGWDTQECGTIMLPAGESTLTLTVDQIPGEDSSCSIKSLELIIDKDRSALLERIREFKSDTTWFSKAKYGVMVQHGSWSYPKSGDRKPLEQAANDFDVAQFVSTLKEMGASYLVYSLTWWDYKILAPIRSVDHIVGDKEHTTERDVVGELAKACHAENIRFLLYYHIGHDGHKGINSTPWWRAQKVPHEQFTKTGVADRSVCLNNWMEVVGEVGQRYGKLLDGWFFDDGCCYYPAPFEALGKAAKAGNPGRIISYNPWSSTRITDFQDMVMGEGSRGQMEFGSAEPGGDGVVTKGRNQGLLQHGMFTLERGWGVKKQNQKARGGMSADALIESVKSASGRNVPLSVSLMVWEDGLFHPESVQSMRQLRKAMEGK